MNILEILQEVSKRIKEPLITDAFSNDNQPSMYLASANKIAKEIARRHIWSNLILDGTINTAIGTQDYDLPEDFKEMVTDNLYNKTRQWAIPRETPDNAIYYVATGNQSWTDTRFRIVRNKFRFTIEADSVDEIIYEYKTNTISENDDDTYTSEFKTNNSQFLLDDELLIKGIVYDLYKQYGSNDAPRLLVEFEELLTDEISKDGGKFIISSSYEQKKYPYPRNWNTVGGSDY